MSVYPRVAVNIRQARQAQRLALEELADRAGIASSYLGQIERSERKPSLRTVVSLASTLRVPVETLVDGSKTKREPLSGWERRFIALLDGASERDRVLAYEMTRLLLRRLRTRAP